MLAYVTEEFDGSNINAQICLLRCPQEISSRYLIQYLFSFNGAKQFKELQTGSALKQLPKKSLGKVKVFLPALLEQQKIADFLTLVDKRIEQLEEKKRLLTEYKKGVMQQIFSQQIRFTDDNGNPYPDWEEKRLGDVFTIGSGKDYKHLNNGDVPVYGTGGYMTSVDEYLHDGESVCIGRKGTIDKPRYLNTRFWTVDTLFFTHSFRSAVPKFIYAVFQTINWKKHNEASGVPSLSKTTIEKIKVEMPSVHEQQKIADFLTSIDNKIEQVGAQLEQAKNVKKGLLQQMFV